VEQCNLLSYNKKPREGTSEKVNKKILEKKLKERAMVSTFFIIIK